MRIKAYPSGSGATTCGGYEPFLASHLQNADQTGSNGISLQRSMLDEYRARRGGVYLSSLVPGTVRFLLIPYPLDLTARHLLLTAVVELGGARIGVAGHVLGHLDRAAVLQEDGDAGRPPAVVTDRRRDPRLAGAALEHAPRIGLGHAVLGELAGLAAGGAEEGRIEQPDVWTFGSGVVRYPSCPS